MMKKKFEEACKKKQVAIEAEEEFHKACSALEDEKKKHENEIKKYETTANNLQLSVAKRGIAKSQLAQLKESHKKTKAAKKYFEEVSALFETIKKKSGIAYGSLWWMKRELEEMQKFKPKKRIR